MTESCLERTSASKGSNMQSQHSPLIYLISEGMCLARLRECCGNARRHAMMTGSVKGSIVLFGRVVVALSKRPPTLQ